MRAIWWKELRELLAPVIVLAALWGFYVADAQWRLSLDKLLKLTFVCGTALGLVQAVLDRLHRDNHFLLHRPVSLSRLHLARTLAGLTACVAVLSVVVVVYAIARVGGRSYAGLDAPPGFAEFLVASVTMLAVWAVVRAVATARRLWTIVVLLVAVPLVISATWGRTSTEFAATLFMLAVAAVAAGLSVVTLTGRRTRPRAVLLLVVVGFAMLETTTWLRAGATELQMDAYPYLGVKDTGEVVFWDRRGSRVEEYDAERKLVATQIVRNYPADLQWLHIGVGPWYSASLFDKPRWLSNRGARAWAWFRLVEVCLNQHQDSSRLRWSFDGGRFLCLDREQNVIAGFGPDGYVRGPDAGRGRTFDAPRRGRLAEIPWVWRRERIVQYIDRSSGTVTVITFPEEAPHEEPLDIQVTTRPLDAPVTGTLPLDSAPFRRFVLGSRLVWLDKRGDTVLRVDLGPDERYVTSWPLVRWEVGKTGAVLYGEAREIKASAVVTRIGPVNPVSERLRVRVMRPGEPMVVHDIAIAPETAGEHLCLVLQGLAGLIRPLPFALASFLAAAPKDWDELHSWFWVDPFFSGRTSGAWLLLSLVVAAACGWLARRKARLRCATPREVRFWTVAGAVLGPVGLLWMWLVVGRERVEPVGTGRRAVNLERSPTVAEPWPEPLATGTEVLV